MAADTRLTFLEERFDTVRQRDDLVAQWIDLRLEAADSGKLAEVHETLRRRHFHSWEGRYGIHHAWVEVNHRLGDLAFERRDFPIALRHYQEATEYPKNLEVAPRTPDFRAHVYWKLARVHEAMGRREEAEDYLRKIVAERYGKAHLGTYYQALAQKSLAQADSYQSLLDGLEAEARKRVSGQFEYRGRPQTIGHYLLALVLDEKGDTDGAGIERKRALERDSQAARLAVREAQLDVARAHQ